MRGRLIDSGYALLGSLGWLFVPKCPICLTAYLAAATGVTIPFVHGPGLRIALLVVTASLFLVGAWRLSRIGQRFKKPENRSNPHQFVQLRHRHAPVEETELARIPHLAGGVEQAGHRRSIK